MFDFEVLKRPGGLEEEQVVQALEEATGALLDELHRVEEFC